MVAALKRRRGGGPELLAYKERGRWHDVRSPDINAYLKEATGGDFSAKDFRTWNATVLAAVALGVAGEVAATKTGRKRAVKRAIDEVATYLGNTPAVCRASYIDPRVFDAYQAGLTIAPALAKVAEQMQPGTLLIHHPRWRPRCSTCSTSARDPPPGAGRGVAQAAALALRARRGAAPAAPHRRAGGDAVDDDGEEHGGDAGPDDELLLGGAEGARPDGDGEVVERADPAHAEPGDEQLVARVVEPRAAQRQHAGERPHEHDEQDGEQPALPARRLQALERQHGAEREDHGELEQLLHPLGALVHRVVDLVVVLVAAEGDAAGEGGEEPVGAGDLRAAEDDERRRDGVEAVERALSMSRLRSRLTLQAAARPMPAPSATATPMA